MDWQDRTRLRGQHIWHELHIGKHTLCMGKCPYKRTAHAPLRPLPLLLAALQPDLILAGTSTPGQRLRQLDITGHHQICGGGNRFPLPPHSFLRPLGLFNFTAFFLSLVLSSPFFFLILSRVLTLLPSMPDIQFLVHRNKVYNVVWHMTPFASLSHPLGSHRKPS